MLRKLARTIFQAMSLIGVLTLTAFAITHVKSKRPVWQHQSGQMLTDVRLLPANLWSFGTTPTTPPGWTTATGAPVSGNTTKYGFVVINHYDLRVWNYDSKTDSLSYDTN